MARLADKFDAHNSLNQGFAASSVTRWPSPLGEAEGTTVHGAGGLRAAVGIAITSTSLKPASLVRSVLMLEADKDKEAAKVLQ
ncbi:hypothetical protein JCM10449v2_006692 [Rhodotorula kratochvilovae]